MESSSSSERTPTTSREKDLTTDKTFDYSEWDTSIDIEHSEGSEADGDDDDEEGSKSGSGSDEDGSGHDASGSESSNGSNSDARDGGDEVEGEVVVVTDVEAVVEAKGSGVNGDNTGVPPRRGRRGKADLDSIPFVYFFCFVV